MTPARPTLDLLRSLTDEHVVRALMEEPRLTRAQLAARTGISKPTASESVRRLAEAGLLRDTGERTTGRGRVGSYYALATGIGWALAVSIGPQRVVAEAVDVYGAVVSRADRQLAHRARTADVARALRAAATRAQAGAPGPARLAVVSVADPVDRATGRLVALPDEPFPVAELAPAETLAPLVDGPVEVDNDVNWAARAERHAARPGSLDDFAYVYLGEGLGCAVVSDGEVRRGHGGLAGEIAHLITTGPRRRALPFTEVFAALGLRREGSAAIDDDRLLGAATAATASARRTRSEIAVAVCGVLAAVVALADPELIVLGGPWGSHPAILEGVSAAFARLPRHVPLRAPQVTAEPSLEGARRAALHRLRQAIVTEPHAASAQRGSTA